MNSGIWNRRFGGSERFDEDVDPSSSLSNMADVMLVLAVGIMLALVMNWNLDIGTGTVPVENVDMDAATELSELEDLPEEDVTAMVQAAGLEEKGKIYRDPKTGKMYMIITE